MILLVVVVAVVMIMSFLPTDCHAGSVTSSGIGITLNGPDVASVNESIIYSVTVANLGSGCWDRNLTVTDFFPNGTFSTWKVPDLAPMGQNGSIFFISNIVYTIQQGDLIVGNVSYIDNCAWVTGAAYFPNGVTNPLAAYTSFITFVSVPVVGGFSVPINIKGSSATPLAIYIISTVIAAALLPASSAFRRRGLRKRRQARAEKS